MFGPTLYPAGYGDALYATSQSIKTQNVMFDTRTTGIGVVAPQKKYSHEQLHNLLTSVLVSNKPGDQIPAYTNTRIRMIDPNQVKTQAMTTTQQFYKAVTETFQYFWKLIRSGAAWLWANPIFLAAIAIIAIWLIW